MKRRFIIPVTLAALGLLQNEAQGQGPAPARVEYVRPIPAPDISRLLGSDGKNLYLARKNGQVDAIDIETGTTAFSLQMQDAPGGKPLSDARAVAASRDTLYVLDGAENRVVMFGLDGKYKGQFGRRSGMAGLSSPQGMALANGILYVADTGNGRIQMYGDNGVFLQTLPIATAEANKALDAKVSPWKLEKPLAVGVDKTGNIHVLDGAGNLFSDRSLIKVYAADGRFLRAFLKNGKPVAMQVGAGNSYVADGENYSVQRYDTQGNLAAMFGSRGTGRGQVQSLSGLAFIAGNIHVGDADLGVVHHFRVPPEPEDALLQQADLPPSVRWQQSLPLAASRMAWNGKDTLLAIARDKPGVLLRWQEGQPAATEQALAGVRPSALAFDKSGALWAVEQEGDRLVRLAADGQADMTVGTRGNRNGQFNAPSDLVIASDGSIYVADSGNGRIQGFTADGVFFRVIDKGMAGKLKRPVALSIDDKDNLYVLDGSRDSVTVYNAAGEPLREFGNDKERPEERLDAPQGLMATQDEVFVLTRERVRVFSHEGRLLRSFGAPGDAAGELSGAVAIAVRDASSFFIADGAQARVQLLSTQYRPKPPEAFKAEPEVHRVALRWEASPLAYVKQYVIYRAEAATGPWRPVANSKTTEYIDPNLKPGNTFHYRMTAATAEGLEGPASAAVSAAALKYTPPPLQDVQPEAGPSSARIRFKPLDSALVKAYRVYQKDGEQFRQLAESAEPDLPVEKLEAGKTYTFWLSTLSVDDVESEKQAVQVVTQADTRAPLEIDIAQLTNVFSNSYKAYEKDGVGAVKLTNNTSSTLSDIKVSFVLNNFMDYPTEQHIAALAPGASAQVALKAVFNNNILTLTEDSPVQAKIEASYFENGQPKVFFQIKSINIYDKHRLSWDEPRRYAAFVTPKDPVIMSMARSVAAETVGAGDATQVAAALFNALGTLGLAYVQDPTNPYQRNVSKVDYVDYIQYPRETLQRRSGDCDDLVALYVSALESLGISTRVLLVPGHMLMMLNTGVEAPADGYTMNNMYVASDGMLWIPVEATLVGKSFTKAWESGAATYYQHKGKEGFGVLNIHEAWDTIKPATLTDDPWRPSVVNREMIDRQFPGDLRQALKISSQTRAHTHLEAIRKNPGDVQAYLQAGIVLARHGDRDEAKKYFGKVLESQPNQAAALNNMGNLHMLESQYDEAEKLYTAATQSDPGDAEIWINLAQARKAAQNVAGARQAFLQARKLDPAVTNKYKALGLQLLNNLPGAQPGKKATGNK